MTNTLKITKVREVKTPNRGTSVAAGIDFFVPTNIPVDELKEKTSKIGSAAQIIGSDKVEKIILRPGDSILIPSGIKMKIPESYALIFFNKSGVASKKQLIIGASVVDEDYEGEVHINVVNTGTNEQTIEAGDKIVQGILIPMFYANVEEVATVDELFADSNSVRGEGGFGSTGTK